MQVQQLLLPNRQFSESMATYAFAARGYRPRRYLRLRPRRHPANRGGAREPSLLAPKEQECHHHRKFTPLQVDVQGKKSENGNR